MEASVAAQGDAGQAQGQQAAAQDAGQQQGGFDMQALQQQLESLPSRDDLRELLSQRQEPAQQEEAEPEPEAADLSFLDPMGPDYNPDQVAQQFDRLVEQRVQRGIEQALQQHVAPIQETLQQQQYETKARDLAMEFPALEDEKTVRQLVHQSGELAQILGQPQLANNPDFWRLVYTSGLAHEQAQHEQSAAQEQPAHLEGGGAFPGVGQGQDPGDMIVNANKRGGNGLPSWW